METPKYPLPARFGGEASFTTSWYRVTPGAMADVKVPAGVARVEIHDREPAAFRLVFTEEPQPEPVATEREKAARYLEGQATQASPGPAWLLRTIAADLRKERHLSDFLYLHMPPYEVAEAEEREASLKTDPLSGEWAWPDESTRAIWASSLEQILEYAAKEHGKSQGGYFSPFGGGGKPLHELARWLRGPKEPATQETGHDDLPDVLGSAIEAKAKAPGEPEFWRTNWRAVLNERDIAAEKERDEAQNRVRVLEAQLEKEREVFVRGNPTIAVQLSNRAQFYPGEAGLAGPEQVTRIMNAREINGLLEDVVTLRHDLRVQEAKAGKFRGLLGAIQDTANAFATAWPETARGHKLNALLSDLQSLLARVEG